ncbi:MAG: hypothetical protein D6788_06730 [Planctomycetota bacterium]|nr:MAG: hypothetical protein D6788_06730 [Planctomycetota bacterium]
MVLGSLLGCGSQLGGLDPRTPLFVVSPCGGDPVAAEEVVALTLQGGVTPIYPGVELPPLDLAAFRIPGGRTLADDPRAFRQAVAERISRIFCESGSIPLSVVWADEIDPDSAPPGVTVHFTQSLAPDGGDQVGQGEYDVCNRQHDNVALVYGERLRRLAGVQSFEDWGAMFANVAAHEVAHALGYGHVPRGQGDGDTPERPLYVELMLDGHTLAELRQAQRIVTPQDTCPTQRRWLSRRRYPTIP